jgi:hypothetical protein
MTEEELDWIMYNYSDFCGNERIHDFYWNTVTIVGNGYYIELRISNKMLHIKNN